VNSEINERQVNMKEAFGMETIKSIDENHVFPQVSPFIKLSSVAKFRDCHFWTTFQQVKMT